MYPKVPAEAALKEFMDSVRSLVSAPDYLLRFLSVLIISERVVAHSENSRRDLYVSEKAQWSTDLVWRVPRQTTAAAMAARPPQRQSPASRMPFVHGRRLGALHRTAGHPTAQQAAGRAWRISVDLQTAGRAWRISVDLRESIDQGYFSSRKK